MKKIYYVCFVVIHLFIYYEILHYLIIDNGHCICTNPFVSNNLQTKLTDNDIYYILYKKQWIRDILNH